MTDRRWEQVGAGTGIVFVVLLLIVLIFTPEPPDFDASAEEVAQYYSEERSDIQFGNVVGSVAIFFFIWFLGTVRSALRLAEGATGRVSAIAYGGGLVFAAAVVLFVTFSAAAALRPDETPAELTRSLHDLSFGMAPAVGFAALTATFAAITKLSLRSGAFSAPIGWLAALTAIACALGVGSQVDESGAFSADGVFGYLGIILVLLWALVASIDLIRSPVSDRGPGIGDRVRAGAGEAADAARRRTGI
jgi:hypothetical protein